MALLRFLRAQRRNWTRVLVLLHVFSSVTASKREPGADGPEAGASALLLSLRLPQHTEYEIVTPYEVNHQGAYISHEIEHHKRRRRRSLTAGSSNTGSSSATVHFRLWGLGQDFHMELREASESLMAPGFTIQVLGKNSTKSLRAYHQDDHCFYQGSLRSGVNSSVALSTCSGLVSLNTHKIRLQKEQGLQEG